MDYAIRCCGYWYKLYKRGRVCSVCGEPYKIGITYMLSEFNVAWCREIMVGRCSAGSEIKLKGSFYRAYKPCEYVVEPEYTEEDIEFFESKKENPESTIDKIVYKHKAQASWEMLLANRALHLNILRQFGINSYRRQKIETFIKRDKAFSESEKAMEYFREFKRLNGGMSHGFLERRANGVISFVVWAERLVREIKRDKENGRCTIANPPMFPEGDW